MLRFWNRKTTAPQVPDEGERYAAYAAAEEARLRREMEQAGEAGVQDLLGSLVTVLRAYERSVRIGVYTCAQAQEQYRLKLGAMHRDFARMEGELSLRRLDTSFTGSFFPRPEALIPTPG